MLRTCLRSMETAATRRLNLVIGDIYFGQKKPRYSRIKSNSSCLSWGIVNDRENFHCNLSLKLILQVSIAINFRNEHSRWQFVGLWAIFQNLCIYSFKNVLLTGNCLGYGHPGSSANHLRSWQNIRCMLDFTGLICSIVSPSYWKHSANLSNRLWASDNQLETYIQQRSRSILVLQMSKNYIKLNTLDRNLWFISFVSRTNCWLLSHQMAFK